MVGFKSFLCSAIHALSALVLLVADLLFIQVPRAVSDWLQWQRIARLAEVKFLAVFGLKGVDSGDRAVRMSGMGPVYA
jgi:hypothetical protein